MPVALHRGFATPCRPDKRSTGSRRAAASVALATRWLPRPARYRASCWETRCAGKKDKGEFVGRRRQPLKHRDGSRVLLAIERHVGNRVPPKKFLKGGNRRRARRADENDPLPPFDDDPPPQDQRAHDLFAEV